MTIIMSVLRKLLKKNIIHLIKKEMLHINRRMKQPLQHRSTLVVSNTQNLNGAKTLW